MERILKNAIRCSRCGDVIESMSVHDFKRCSCGTCAVDGGREYLRRCFKDSPDDYEELSAFEPETHEGDAWDLSELHKASSLATHGTA